MLQRGRPPPSWASTAECQHGVIGRGQLIALGLTRAQAHQDVDADRWQTVHPGVYLTHTGPISPLARVWAAVLYGGNGAVASRSTALWLAGALDAQPDSVHISIGHRRRVRTQPGLRIHRLRALDLRPISVVHPAAAPPRLRIENAVLDHVRVSNEVVTVDLVLRVIQRRLTTAARIRDALIAEGRHPWRRLINDVITEASEGVASPLERAYLQKVERAHALPTGRRNAPEFVPGVGRLYRDVRYPQWHVVVELDGREAHPADTAFRDLRRDNRAVVAGEAVLRYGWRDVVGSPCSIATQVFEVLRARGWGGPGRPCSPGCAVRSEVS